MSVEVGNFLLDLVNIEVNTIIKSGMTAEKMPEPDLAVHDVLLEYARYLEQEELEGEAKTKLASLRTMDVFKDRRRFALRGALGEIDLLEATATAQRDAARDTPRKAVLDRILKNLQLLREIVAALPAEPSAKPERELSRRLTLQQRLSLRKMWEFGTEEVVVQTCISLDGDVVTRIDPQLLAKPAELREVLLGVHRESTSVSIRFWSGIVAAATNLIGGLRQWVSSSSSGTGA